MSRRTLRIGSLIRNIVAEAIQSRLSDPRIEPLTSVTRVEVSDDLSFARVFVSVLAPDPRRMLCVQALQGARRRIRALLGDQLSIRKVPEIDFRLDDSLRKSFETIQVLDATMAEYAPQVPEDQPPEGAAPDADEPPTVPPQAERDRPDPPTDERSVPGNATDEDRDARQED